MDTKIVLTGILKDDHEFLIVKRNENDEQRIRMQRNRQSNLLVFLI